MKKMTTEPDKSGYMYVMLHISSYACMTNTHIVLVGPCTDTQSNKMLVSDYEIVIHFIS